MADLILWTNPRCSKSRGAEELRTEQGRKYTARLYLEDPPSRAELEALHTKLGTDDPRAITRKGELPHASREELLECGTSWNSPGLASRNSPWGPLVQVSQP
jgi:arsenate reductase-like glutaredoxin family protein